MFLEARGDAAELLEFAEEPLDQIAASVEVWRDGALLTDPALGRDMGLATTCRHPLDHGEAVVATIGNHCAGRQRIQQHRGRRLVGGLAGCDAQADRQAVLIDDGVDFPAQSATRTELLPEIRTVTEATM